MSRYNFRELTGKEKSSIRKLIIALCANFDNEYGCLPLDSNCYMFGIAFNTSVLCKHFKEAVLQNDLALEAVFNHKPVKSCKRCGISIPVLGRKTYCDACAVLVRKAATAVRVQKHRKHETRNVTL